MIPTRVITASVAITANMTEPQRGGKRAVCVDLQVCVQSGSCHRQMLGPALLSLSILLRCLMSSFPSISTVQRGPQGHYCAHVPRLPWSFFHVSQGGFCMKASCSSWVPQRGGEDVCGKQTCLQQRLNV